MDAFPRYLAYLLLLISGVLVVMIQGEVHYLDFVLKEKNYTRICSTKSMLVVNESLPGPVIRVRKGDTVHVNVHNQGFYGVTIHWHGVKQPRNPWFDGPAYITQCPIQPGTNFTYEVIFTEEEGTVWWHAHSNWTRSSVHGAITVYPSIGTSFPFPEPDGEEILMLGDWYIEDENEMIREEGDIGFFSEHLPKVFTINSLPGDFHNCSSNETIHRWIVEYGKTYLLRLVSVPMDDPTYFAIAGHNLTVVGSDGAYVKPFVTSYVAIGPGQTIDVLVTTNQPGEYYIATRNCFTTNTHLDYFPMLNSTAILQYTGNYTSTFPSYPDGSLPYYTNYMAAIDFWSKFRSLASQDYPIVVPMNISTRMFMTTALNENSRGSLKYLAASLNNLSWVDPLTSVLEAYYWNLTGFYTTDFPNEPPTYFDFLSDYLEYSNAESVMATEVKVLEYNDEVEMVFQSTNIFNSSTNHPMHLHGYSFYVVGMGQGIFDPDEDPKSYNLIDPPYVNTGIVPKLGWIALRFKASNPGVWFLHCHIEHHITYGMQTVFIVKNDGTPETSMRDRPAYMPACPGYGIQMSRSSYEKSKS